MGFPKTEALFSELLVPIVGFHIPVKDARAKIREMLSQKHRIAAPARDIVPMDGFYVDIQEAPFHSVIVGRKDANPHMVLALEGCVEVVTDKGLVAVGQAPCVLRLRENERIVGNVLTARLVFACVHSGKAPSLGDDAEDVVQ